MAHRFSAAGLVVGLGVIGLIVFSPAVSAYHGWLNPAGQQLHWAREANPFPLVIVNSTTNKWDQHVTQATIDWNQTGVLSMQEENGSTSRRVRRSCVAPLGKVRICNYTYGLTGWLGIASVSYDQDGHIHMGFTALNDTYFKTATYNNILWKRSVTCQEIGHNIGLDHQDVDYNSAIPKLSRIDYQDSPFEYPNLHDDEELGLIYTHLDSFNSFYETPSGGEEGGGEGGGGCNAPPGKGCNKPGAGSSNATKGWGISLGRRGHHERFLRIDQDGFQHLTHVRWVDDDDDNRGRGRGR